MASSATASSAMHEDVTLDTRPENAFHAVEIEAFVINDNGQVLVVEEKNGELKSRGVWKLPCGVVSQGEDLSIAAMRVVKEETGLNAKFMEVLAFSHQTYFRKSDLSFVCLLRPLQDSEIVAAQWMAIEEYANQPYQKHNSYKYVAEICLAKSTNNYDGFSAVTTTTPEGNFFYMYFNSKEFINHN